MSDFQKTAALLGVSSFVMGPFYPRLGAAASVAIKCAGLFMLHEYGKRQPGPPVANNLHYFFNADTGKAFGNIVKGGGAVVDMVVPPKGAGWR